MPTTFAILFSFLAAMNPPQIDYAYVSYSGDMADGGMESFKFDMDASVLWLGHHGQKFDVCKREDSFYCIDAPAFKFAIPKSHIHPGSQWERLGQTFSVDREETVEILGQNIPVQVIKQQRDPDRTDEFYYSDIRGLVAIRVDEKERGLHFFILTGENGFPHRSAPNR